MTDYPRVLNGHGCLYGQGLDRRFETFKKTQEMHMKKIEEKLDRLLWAAVGLMLTIVGASLTLWITYIGP